MQIALSTIVKWITVSLEGAETKASLQRQVMSKVTHEIGAEVLLTGLWQGQPSEISTAFVHPGDTPRRNTIRKDLVDGTRRLRNALKCIAKLPNCDCEYHLRRDIIIFRHLTRYPQLSS
jgi:hypothetical protein